jgi:hypothetical protein
MPVIGGQFSSKVLQFLLVNCAVFAAYRLAFIKLFGTPEAFSRITRSWSSPATTRATSLARAPWSAFASR